MAQSEAPAYDAIEALCQHHLVLGFTIADRPDYQQLIELYLDRSARALGDRVLVAVADMQVRGYLASVDITLD